MMMFGELALTGAVRPVKGVLPIALKARAIGMDGIRERVIAARQRQEQRFEGSVRVTCNARMQARDIKQHCPLADEPKNLLRMAMNELNLSARAYDRILKVSRTIADLAGADAINSEHLSETLQYRTLDRQLWG